MDWHAVDRWRRALRSELIGERERIPANEITAVREGVTAHLVNLLALPTGSVIAFCWPYRNEVDCRYAVRVLRDRGARAALPVVVGKAKPLVFRQWWPGAPMKQGVLGIPYPDSTPVLVPDVALVPMVGYDDHGYRLGYGGGYFDRTLAATNPRPVSIGVVAARFRISSIRAQSHDIAMDFVVTERGVLAACEAGLEQLAGTSARLRFDAVLASRGLPRSENRPDIPREHASPVCYAAEFPGYFGETGQS